MATHYRGPLLGDRDSMAGFLSDAPIEFFGKQIWQVYFNDFVDNDFDYDDSGVFWTLTQVSVGGSASIITVANSDTGVLRLDCPANLDGPIIQVDSGATAGLASMGVTPTDATSSVAASDAIFMSRFRILDVSAQGVFVGLAELNVTSAVIGTPSGAITSDTHIGFSQATTDAGAIIFSVAGDDDTAAVSKTGTDVIPSALADGEWIEVAVRATGTTGYKAYVKGGGREARWREIANGSLSAGWDAQMLISMANLGSGTGDDLDVDYVMFAQRRDMIP